METGLLRRCRGCPHRRRLHKGKRTVPPKDKTAEIQVASTQSPALLEEANRTNAEQHPPEDTGNSNTRAVALLGDADCHYMDHSPMEH